MLYIQKKGCLVKPRFEDTRQPAFVSDSAAWNRFSGIVSEATSKMWSEKIGLYAFFLFPVVFAPHFIVRGSGADGGYILSIISFVTGIVMVAAFIVPRMWAIKQNEVQDQRIQEACNDLASKTGLSVHYRTQWTGFCKPKHATPFRGIAIGPQAAPIGCTLMTVMVPEGHGPGTVLQVQSPQGQTIQVTVPPGVGAGQSFQCQVPAAAPVTVTGTVVG